MITDDRLDGGDTALCPRSNAGIADAHFGQTDHSETAGYDRAILDIAAVTYRLHEQALVVIRTLVKGINSVVQRQFNPGRGFDLHVGSIGLNYFVNVFGCVFDLSPTERAARLRKHGRKQTVVAERQLRRLVDIGRINISSLAVFRDFVASSCLQPDLLFAAALVDIGILFARLAPRLRRRRSPHVHIE